MLFSIVKVICFYQNDHSVIIFWTMEVSLWHHNLRAHFLIGTNIAVQYTLPSHQRKRFEVFGSNHVKWRHFRPYLLGSHLVHTFYKSWAVEPWLYFYGWLYPHVFTGETHTSKPFKSKHYTSMAGSQARMSRDGLCPAKWLCLVRLSSRPAMLHQCTLVETLPMLHH